MTEDVGITRYLDSSPEDSADLVICVRQERAVKKGEPKMNDLQNLLADIRALLLQSDKPEAQRLVTRIDGFKATLPEYPSPGRVKPKRKKKGEQK